MHGLLAYFAALLDIVVEYTGDVHLRCNDLIAQKVEIFFVACLGMVIKFLHTINLSRTSFSTAAFLFSVSRAMASSYEYSTMIPAWRTIMIDLITHNATERTPNHKQTLSSALTSAFANTLSDKLK